MRGIRLATAVPALMLCAAAFVPGARREALCAAAPRALAVSVSLDPAEIRVGDAARLTVTVDHPGAGNLALPELDRGRAVVVTDRKQETAPLPGGQPGAERTTFVLLLTSFEPGQHRVAHGQIAFTGAGAESLAAAFPETTLRTRSVLAGPDTPMRGIKGLAHWPAPRGRWAAVAAAAAGVLLLAAAVLLVARRRTGGRRIAPAAREPAASPHDIALRALTALRAGMAARQQQPEPFYRELSSVVRRYIEERFGLRAPELTTEELIREASGSGLLAPAHQALVREFLERCDLVKFARHLPAFADMTAAIDAAERLVRETKGSAGP